MPKKHKKKKKQLRIIENFLYEKYDVEVHYEREDRDAYYESLNRVEINSRQNYNSRLHSLLHEAGHVMLRNGSRSGERSFRGRFPNMNHQRRSSRVNLKHRIDVLREEILAWEMGEKLAYDLGIVLDKSLWSHHRSSALKDYIKWVV